MLQVTQIPVLQDNYLFVAQDKATGKTAVVDPAVAEPVLELLRESDDMWLDYILNTHHHADHVGGNWDLIKATGCEVVGYREDAERIPGISIELRDGDTFKLGESVAEVMFVPGHTLGHIAYWFKEDKILFCGDTLFAMGCGRLFEGTPEQMFDSLNKIAALPDDTTIYCAHEYTEANGNFALSVEPDNNALKERMQQVHRLRERHIPTIPTELGLERKTNPFLRCANSNEFAEVRAKKDRF